MFRSSRSTRSAARRESSYAYSEITTRKRARRNKPAQTRRLEPNRSLDQLQAQIIREYNRLRARIQPLAPLAPRSKRQREVMSLTSKALWLCYPNDVPIFDDYALRAIQVISKICRICPMPDQGLYESFVDVWLQFYDRIRSVIENSDLHGYQYKMRVLDGFLWYLGKPDFEVTVASRGIDSTE